MADEEIVTVAELPDAPNPTRHKKEIDEAVGATAFGCNLYVADPGQRLPWGYHQHPDHEELFYVLAGRLVVETADGDRDLAAGEAMFVPPGVPTCARAVGDEPARVMAVGAPKESDGAVVNEPCPSCGESTDRDSESRDGAFLLFCADCGTQTDRLTAGPADDSPGADDSPRADDE